MEYVVGLFIGILCMLLSTKYTYFSTRKKLHYLDKMSKEKKKEDWEEKCGEKKGN